jgi:opacity protein-like surface antigen
MRQKILGAGLILAAGLCGRAWAQDDTADPAKQPLIEPAQTPPEAEAAAKGEIGGTPAYFSIENFYLYAGGGFINFSDRGTEDITNAGGTWMLRAAFGIATPIAIEGGYFGGAFPVHSIAGNGSVISTGLEVIGRVGYPIHRGLAFIVPYIGAGVGWNLYSLAGGLTTEETGIQGSDSTFTIPLAVGLGMGYEHLNFDLRFLYRPTYGDNMFDDAITTGFDSGLSTVELSAMMGYRF